MLLPPFVQITFEIPYNIDQFDLFAFEWSRRMSERPHFLGNVILANHFILDKLNIIVVF